MKQWFYKHKLWLILTFAFLQVTAYFSAGPLHPDEHWQIIEFMNLKLGGISAAQLPWEFAAQLRPWLQPAFYYVLISAVSPLLGDDPFVLTWFLRSISAGLGWILLIMLYRLSEQKSQSCARVAAYLLPFTMYIPYLFARTSSEHYGSVCFWAGLCLFAVHLNTTEPKPLDRTRALLIGILWGLAFEFRYQMGLMILGACLWWILVYRQPLRQTFAIIGGIVGVVLVALFVDRWGYGEWCFPPWNYLRVNLLEGVAAQFGREPWWFYFSEINRKIPSPIGVLTVLSLLVFWIKYPKSVFTAPAILFTLTHLALSHKEFRFLIPVYYIAPFYLAIFVADLLQHWQSRPKLRRILGTVLVLLALFNTSRLLKSSFKPMRDFFPATEYLARKERPFALYWLGENPFVVVPGLLEFYGAANIAFKELSSLQEADKIARQETFYFYSMTKTEERLQNCKLLRTLQHPLRFSSSDLRQIYLCGADHE